MHCNSKILWYCPSQEMTLFHYRGVAFQENDYCIVVDDIVGHYCLILFFSLQRSDENNIYQVIQRFYPSFKGIVHFTCQLFFSGL